MNLPSVLKNTMIGNVSHAVDKKVILCQFVPDNVQCQNSPLNAAIITMVGIASLVVNMEDIKCNNVICNNLVE